MICYSLLEKGAETKNSRVTSPDSIPIYFTHRAADGNGNDGNVKILSPLRGIYHLCVLSTDLVGYCSKWLLTDNLVVSNTNIGR